MGLLDGKRLLITGVITDSSIAFHVARLAQEQGATVVLTGFGRMSLVERIARRLPDPPPVLELDVTNAEQLASLPDRVREHVGVAGRRAARDRFRAVAALGGSFLDAPWEDVATAVQVSTYSLKSLAMAALPLIRSAAARSSGWTSTPASPGRPTTGWAWPRRPWSRLLALPGPRPRAEQQIRVNLVAAGPMRTMAAKSIPGFEQFEDSGPAGRRSAGTEQSVPAARALLPCCRTGSRLRPARSCTSTAASTPWAAERVSSRRETLW